MVEFSPEPGGLYRLGFAGDTFNTAWAMRLLLPKDVSVRYLTAVGTDWMSDALLAFMAESGIDTSFIARLPDRGPGLYATRIVAGERTFAYWRRDSAATQLARDPAALGAGLADASLVLLSGITLAILPPEGRTALIAALAEARARGARIAFDPNYRARLWPDAATARASFEAAYRLTDIALPTFDDESALFGDATPADTAARLRAEGAREVVVKHGAGPALYDGPTGRFSVPAQTVAAVVDTSGAGDAFNAGFLAAQLQGASPPDAVRRGHAVAAVAVQSRGALVPATLRVG